MDEGRSRDEVRSRDEGRSMDALLPPAMARRAEETGVLKASAPVTRVFALGVLAGAFIALGAAFSTTVVAGTGDLPYGVARLLAGVPFSLGLVLVVVGGAELFTGNNLIVMAWASGKVRTRALLANWGVVYAGNLVGALGTAVLVLLARQYEQGGGRVGAAMLSIADAKCRFGFVQAVALGVLCNTLVCLAVWMTYSARSTADRVLAVLFPIAGFVACGFEHSIANLYYVPLSLALEQGDPAFAASTGLDLSALAWEEFLVRNLLPVTLGNVVGGSVLVALVYWLVYLRPARRTPPS